jgi:hypothetical protein
MDDLRTECRADTLMAKADAQNWDIRLCDEAGVKPKVSFSLWASGAW